MNASRTTDSAALTTSGIAGVIAAAGIVTFALFPLAIPFLLLTAVFTAPLVLIGLAAALPLGILAAVVVAVRAIARRTGGRPGGTGRLEPAGDRARASRDADEVWARPPHTSA